MTKNARPLEPSPVGVLPRQALRAAIGSGWIHSSAGIPDAHVQPASLDLTLGTVAYRLRCSFLPGARPVRDKLRIYQMGEIDLAKGAVLEQDRPYLIPLQEHLQLPPSVRGRANPRSSTGRLDVFTRLVTDLGDRFDEVPYGYRGQLYLEVVPRSFTIKVRTGQRLNQLRLISGDPRVSDDDLVELNDLRSLMWAGPTVSPGERAAVSDGLFLSVDLSQRDRKFVGYRAKRSSALLDLDVAGQYEVGDFWERLQLDYDGRLILEPGDFYLLVSRERVRIPANLAAEMAAYDPTSGELRTHYAGFFDPGFGDVREGQRQGTPAVLEVRAHDVAFALEHGQRLCKLTFEKMQAPADKPYGLDLGSRYQRQHLALGRQFKRDPASEMDRDEDLTLFPEEPMALERLRTNGEHAIGLANERLAGVVSRLERHVVRSGGRWAVETPGEPTLTVHFDRQDEAIVAARELARTSGGVVAVHGRDGVVRRANNVRRSEGVAHADRTGMHNPIRVLGPVRESAGTPGRIEVKVATPARRPVAIGHTVLVGDRHYRVVGAERAAELDPSSSAALGPGEIIVEILADPG